MDRVDWVATIGFGGVVAGAWLFDLEALLLAAIVGGFVLSISLWRLYDGRVWEALGWLAWLVAAVTLAFGLEDALHVGVFLVAILTGLSLQYGDRFGLLPDIWTEQ
ncbi:hypothetical protein ACYJ1Y_05710 [Natrialbaceae archaeon A-gly3]